MKDVLRRICELQPSYSLENTREMQERGQLVRQALTSELRSLQWLLAPELGRYGDAFNVGASDGIGRKTEAPWVRFCSSEMSPKPTDGYYVVIHFKRNGSGLYLTLGCGSTNWNGGSLIPLKPDQLARKTEMAKKAIEYEHGILEDFTDIIDLGAKAPLPKTFERATAIAKFISVDQIYDQDFEALLSKLAAYLRTVYDAQSSGFDLTEADQVQLEIEQTIRPKKQRNSAQGFGLSAPEKKAVELRAMKIVTEWLDNNGYSTEDQSSTQPYDILAQKNGEKTFVEVKGTTSQDPSAILMTANEVDLHKQNKGKTALAIVSSINLVKGSEPTARGGELYIKIGWDIDDWSLTPTAFRVEKPKPKSS